MYKCVNTAPLPTPMHPPINQPVRLGANPCAWWPDHACRGSQGGVGRGGTGSQNAKNVNIVGPGTHPRALEFSCERPQPERGDPMLSVSLESPSGLPVIFGPHDEHQTETEHALTLADLARYTNRLSPKRRVPDVCQVKPGTETIFAFSVGCSPVVELTGRRYSETDEPLVP